jgi:Fibronectin type III domain
MPIAPRATRVVLGLSVVLAACQEPTTPERGAVIPEPSYDLVGAACARGTGSTATITVKATPPKAGPSGLRADNITATSARILWTNGDTTATTFVQYRITGQTQWITANGGAALPPKQSSYNLTGLHCATSYDVSVFHQKNGLNSPADVLTLFITTACQTSATVKPPTGFHRFDCTPGTTNGKPNATYHLRWTAGANPATSIFHVGESFSNNSASAVVIRRGPISTLRANVGPYTIAGASSRYYWVRHVNGALASSWTALLDNPIVISQGCAPPN